VQTEFWSVAIVGLLTLVAGSVASHDGAKGSAAAGGASAGGVEDLSQHYEAVTGRIELDGTEPVIGPADAKFVMVEWADFECPYCAVMSEELKKILAENPDVKLYFKHYPISEKCNSFVEGERHKDACNAAAASECARLQGRFWELSRQMFKNQEFLGKEDIRFMAEQQQMDMTAFEACMADASTSEAIRQDVAAGGVAGVEGTPSIFVKGVYGDGYVRFSTMDKDAINAVLAAARAGQTLPAPRPHPEH
jgi:protein-disulfide isomerase